REEEGLARVQVLRGAVVEDAAPKSHRPPLQIVDRKDQPIPERVVMPPAGRPRHGQARLLEGGGGEPPGVERPEQVVPARPGLPERERPGPHDEVEDIPAGMTAEAVEETALRIDGERRGLLRVEWAEAFVVAAGPAQGDVRGHDI